MLTQEITDLVAVLDDDGVDVDGRVDAVATRLGRLPDRGAAAAAAVAATHARGSFASNYLALLPGHRDLKWQVIRSRLAAGGPGVVNASGLIHDLSDEQVDAVIDYCARVDANSDEAGSAYNLLYEVAMDHPGRLRRRPRIPMQDADIDRLLLAGADDGTVAALAEDYARTHDAEVIGRLALVRTDAALDALLSLAADAPTEHHDAFAVAVQNAGVQPDTRQASVWFRAYRGYVVPAGTTPHVMGGAPDHAVPQCPVCDTVATRLLTLDRVALAEAGITLDSPYDPSFYWYVCDHPPDSISVHHTPVGPVGLMTGPACPPPAPAGDIVPGRFSLLLEAHPNQDGTDVGDGSGRHRVGGYPHWPFEPEKFPHCPLCGHFARFLTSLDVTTPYGRLRLAGTGSVKGFWCDACAVSISCASGDDG